MVSDFINLFEEAANVLILVVMEYGLRPMGKRTPMMLISVLILVVMEYGLRLKPQVKALNQQAVLILVVMEYGLRHTVIRVN